MDKATHNNDTPKPLSTSTADDLMVANGTNDAVDTPDTMDTMDIDDNDNDNDNDDWSEDDDDDTDPNAYYQPLNYEILTQSDVEDDDDDVDNNELGTDPTPPTHVEPDDVLKAKVDAQWKTGRASMFAAPAKPVVKPLVATSDNFDLSHENLETIRSLMLCMPMPPSGFPEWASSLPTTINQRNIQHTKHTPGHLTNDNDNNNNNNTNTNTSTSNTTTTTNGNDGAKSVVSPPPMTSSSSSEFSSSSVLSSSSSSAAAVSLTQKTEQMTLDST